MNEKKSVGSHSEQSGFKLTLAGYLWSSTSEKGTRYFEITTEKNGAL